MPISLHSFRTGFLLACLAFFFGTSAWAAEQKPQGLYYGAGGSAMIGWG